MLADWGFSLWVVFSLKIYSERKKISLGLSLWQPVIDIQESIALLLMVVEWEKEKEKAAGAGDDHDPSTI